MDASIAELDRYQKALIQIATPFSTGTGFYLAKYNVIVTCEHLVRGNKKVVINNDYLGKQLSTLLYLDPQYDMAFLKGPATKLTSIELSTREVRMGELVTAIGHPYGQELATSNGVISNINQKRNDLVVLMHSATLNPGHNGGPLLDQYGYVVGMNTFLMHSGENRALALPAHYIIRALEEFELGGRNFTVRCHLCHHLVVKGSSDGHCSQCGSKVFLPNEIGAYEPRGINKTIEEILAQLGQDIELARIGPNLWEVIEGSAKVYLSYHEESGLIIGDSFLAQLPEKAVGSVYEYLLRENYLLDDLSFSVKGKDIILSLIIYDRYLNVDTAEIRMKRLFEKSDHYDNILVESYGAKWK